jgi:nucleoid-associated protein EbfC
VLGRRPERPPLTGPAWPQCRPSHEDFPNMQTIDQEEMAMLKGGLGGLMKQAQKMQEDMQKVQAELANMEVDGQAGGGLVRVVMTGKHEVRRVSIDPSLFEDDRDMIEDLVAAAVNDAVHKAEAAAQERMSGLTAGMGLPAGMKLPF